MTTFFADVRIYINPRHEDVTLSVEIPGADIHTALAALMAWKAGLSVHHRFDTAMEETISASRTRGRTYMTMREAAQHLRNNVFS